MSSSRCVASSATSMCACSRPRVFAVPRSSCVGVRPRLATLLHDMKAYAKAAPVMSELAGAASSRLQDGACGASAAADAATDALRCAWFRLHVGDGRAASSLLQLVCSAASLPPHLLLEAHAATAAAAAVTGASSDTAAGVAMPVDAPAGVRDAWTAVALCNAGARARALSHRASSHVPPAAASPPVVTTSGSGTTPVSGDDQWQLARQHYGTAASLLAEVTRSHASPSSSPSSPSGGEGASPPRSLLRLVSDTHARVLMNEAEMSWDEAGPSADGVSSRLSQALKLLDDGRDDVGGSGLGRALTLTARVHHAANNAVTAEGLFRAAVSKFGGASVGRAPDVTSLSPQARRELRDTLLWYSGLLHDWERREPEAVVLRDHAAGVHAAVVVGIPGADAARVTSRVALAPWSFDQH